MQEVQLQIICIKENYDQSTVSLKPIYPFTGVKLTIMS